MIFLVPSALSIDEYIMAKAAGRFVGAFQETWNRIPLADRNKLEDYLKDRHSRVHLCFHMNAFEQGEEPFGRFIWFKTTTVFSFLAPVFERVEPTESKPERHTHLG